MLGRDLTAPNTVHYTEDPSALAMPSRPVTLCGVDFRTLYGSQREPDLADSNYMYKSSPLAVTFVPSCQPLSYKLRVTYIHPEPAGICVA